MTGGVDDTEKACPVGVIARLNDLAAARRPLEALTLPAGATATLVAVGIYAAVRGWRGYRSDIVVLAVGAAILANVQGVADVAVLIPHRSPLPSLLGCPALW